MSGMMQAEIKRKGQKWPMVKLGDLILVKGGKRLPKGAEYSQYITGHPYIRVCDMTLGSVKTPKEELKYITDEAFEKIKRYTITSDDLFISIAGSIGITGLISEELSGANLTENAAKLVIKDNDLICKKYLSWYLNTAGRESINSQIKATSQPKLALFRIEELQIPLPPLEEQKRIAAILDKADGIRRKLAYTEIVEIRLQTGHIPRSGDFGACAIKFRNGVLLTVNSLNSWGTPDDERVDPYITFVEDLHARLGQEDRGRIRFLAGNTDGRYRFGVFAAVLAGAFFVVLPLVLVFVTGESEALFLTLAGVFFVYPVIRVIRKNEPRSYNPQRLDDDLFP